MDVKEGIQSDKKAKVKEINLKEIYIVLKRRIWVLLFITLLITIAGALYSKYTTTYLYQSSTRVLIPANPNQMNTLIVMMKDPEIMEKVIKELGISRSPDGLASQITTNKLNDSQVVSISVLDEDPKIAAMIANTTAKVFKTEIAKILKFRDVQLLKEAEVNPYPINEGILRKILIFALIGMVLGAGAVFLLNSLDDTIKVEHEIEEQFGISVIGTIPKITKRNLKGEMMQEEVKVRGETVGIQ